MGYGLLNAVPMLLAAKHPVSFHLNFSVQPILALIAGVLILIRPKLLNFIVAAYLIVVGVIGVFGLQW